MLIDGVGLTQAPLILYWLFGKASSDVLICIVL